MYKFSFQRYSNPPRQVLRHIVLSDFKEKVPLAQFIKKETDPMLMYDPLPPLDSINIYSRFVRKGRLCYYSTEDTEIRSFCPFCFSRPTLTTNAQRLPNDPLHLFFQGHLPFASALAEEASVCACMVADAKQIAQQSGAVL